MVCLATKWDTFNNNDDDSFDKDILDADSKKVMQYHFRLKTKNMHRKYVSYVWRMWGRRDIRRDDKCEAMYKAGLLCLLGIM